jgi:predicted DNA-binding transcriptional regulator AlpA
MISPPKASSTAETRALSLPEFCAAYKVSRQTAYRLIAAGDLPDVKILNKRIIPIDAAEGLLKARGAR